MIYIYLFLFSIIFIVDKLIILQFMRTQMRWQKAQDEMILKLADGRKRDLEREIAHLKVSAGINDTQGKIIERLEP